MLRSQYSALGWHSDTWLCEGCDAGLAVPVINNNNDNRPNFGSTSDCDIKVQEDKISKDTTTNSANSNISINIDIFDANDESLQKRDKTSLKLGENPPDNNTDNVVGVMCPSCNWIETLVEVERVEGALEVHLEKLPMDNNEEGRLMAEEILSRWEATRLHPHHHILMAAKRKVALSPAGLGTLGNHAN